MIAASGLALPLLGSFFVFAVLSSCITVFFAKWSRDEVRDVVPKAGPFPVRHSIFTIVQVIKGQGHDAFLTLQQARLRVLHDPVAGVKVFDNIKSFLHYSVGLLDLSGTNRLGDAMFNARRGSPVEWEIVKGESAVVVPAQDVAVDVGG